MKRPRAAAQERAQTEAANIEKLDQLLHRRDDFLSFSEDEEENSSEQTQEKPLDEKLTGAAKRKVFNIAMTRFILRVNLSFLFISLVFF